MLLAMNVCLGSPCWSIEKQTFKLVETLKQGTEEETMMFRINVQLNIRITCVSPIKQTLLNAYRL